VLGVSILHVSAMLLWILELYRQCGIIIFFISLFLRDVDGLDIEDFVLCILVSEVMSLSIMIVISLKTLFRFRCSIFVNRIREKKKLERYLRSD
jgi:hypothetical protein